MPTTRATEKYILTLTAEQASAVMDACELFARLHIGQFERITEKLLHTDEPDFEVRCTTANTLCQLLAKLILGTAPNGLCKINRTDHSERAWNVYQSIRHATHEYRYPTDQFSIPETLPHSMIDEAVPPCEVREGGDANA